jgi:hypothetical protein
MLDGFPTNMSWHGSKPEVREHYYFVANLVIYKRTQYSSHGFTLQCTICYTTGNPNPAPGNLGSPENARGRDHGPSNRNLEGFIHARSPWNNPIASN